MSNKYTKKCKLKPQKEATTQFNRTAKNKKTDNLKY